MNTLLVGSYPILLKRQPGLLDSEKYLYLRDIMVMVNNSYLLQTSCWFGNRPPNISR